MEEESPLILLLGHMCCWLAATILLLGSAPTPLRSSGVLAKEVSVLQLVNGDFILAQLEPPAIPLENHAPIADDHFSPFPAFMDDLTSLEEEFPQSLAAVTVNSLDKISPRIPEEEGTEEIFHEIILEAANRYEVDVDLIKAIVKAESGYNPQANSRKGAKGLMQLMPTTARALGVDDMFDPVHNVNAGVRYFKQLLDRFHGDVELALAAYNAGSRKVIQSKGIPPIKATQYYVKRVFQYYQNYKKRKRGKMDDA